jgi:hypothetical protein
METDIRFNDHPIVQYGSIILSLTAYSFILIRFINLDFPLLGHDYRYFLPHMVDTYLHYKVNGFSIQWFTPSFGGGLPAFPNPQQIQFSLPQFLLNFMNPWNAILTSLVTFAIIGYWGFYKFGHKVLKLHWISSALGAFFFIANGFYFSKAKVGQVGYQTFPLLAIIIYVLFSPSISVLAAGSVIGIVIAAILHSAGFYVSIIILFATPITFLMLYLIKPSAINIKEQVQKIIIGGGIGFLISSGKIFAVYSFMRNYPRIKYEYYHDTVIKGLEGLFWQLAGVMSIYPLEILQHEKNNWVPNFLSNKVANSFGHNIWALDISLSPVLLVLIFIGLIWTLFFFDFKNFQKVTPKQIIAALLLFFVSWTAFEFSAAQGEIYNLIKPLPIFRSLHVNARFASSFIIPLTLLGTVIFEKIIFQIKPFWKMALFQTFLLSTIAFLTIYLKLDTDMYRISYQVEELLFTFEQTKNEEIFEISTVSDLKDSETFINHTSSLSTYEPMFGYRVEPANDKLIEASAYLNTSGSYNFTNPKSYLKIEKETAQEVKLFSTEDDEILRAFLAREQPNWHLPKIFYYINYISMVTFLIAFSITITSFYHKN